MISKGSERSQKLDLPATVKPRAPPDQQILPYRALSHSQTFPIGPPIIIASNKGREALKEETHNTNKNPHRNSQASIPYDATSRCGKEKTMTDPTLCLVADTSLCHCRYEDYKRKAYLEWIAIAEGQVGADGGYESFTHTVHE